MISYGQGTRSEKDKLSEEVKLLQSLKHDNIVRYQEFIDDEKNATLYIVMDYCEKGDLQKLITQLKKEVYVIN